MYPRGRLQVCLLLLSAALLCERNTMFVERAMRMETSLQHELREMVEWVVQPHQTLDDLDTSCFHQVLCKPLGKSSCFIKARFRSMFVNATSPGPGSQAKSSSVICFKEINSGNGILADRPEANNWLDFACEWAHESEHSTLWFCTSKSGLKCQGKYITIFATQNQFCLAIVAICIAIPQCKGQRILNVYYIFRNTRLGMHCIDLL